MLISTALGMEFHRYRRNEMRKAADQARLVAELPRKNRSFKFGGYRLNLVREVTPHVSRMV